MCPAHICFDSWKISQRNSRSHVRAGACRGPLDGVKIAISLFRYAALSQRGAANARSYRSCKSNGRASLVIRQVFRFVPNDRFSFFLSFFFFCQRCNSTAIDTNLIKRFSCFNYCVVIASNIVDGPFRFHFYRGSWKVYYDRDGFNYNYNSSLVLAKIAISFCDRDGYNNYNYNYNSRSITVRSILTAILLRIFTNFEFNQINLF